jgi:RNAse (barnase) inhibitor barstar
MIELPDQESPPFVQLLPLASEAGAYHLPVGHTAALTDAAEELGLSTHRIDLGGCIDKQELLQRIAAALSFPDWFGHNWDALSDALSDLAWLDETAGYVIVLERTRELRESAQDDYDMLVGIFDGTADGWREIGVPFWTFLCEDGAR